MRDRFVKVIEDATGQRVIGFMSGNQQEHDKMCETFILAPATSSTSTSWTRRAGRPWLADPDPGRHAASRAVFLIADARGAE